MKQLISFVAVMLLLSGTAEVYSQSSSAPPNEKIIEAIDQVEKIQENFKPEAPLNKAPIAVKKPVKPQGDKQTWMKEAGIPETQWVYVDYIVSRESGWNPCAFYPGKSNCNFTVAQVNASNGITGSDVACGLAQSLPCGKQAKYGHWADPVANLKWQYEYVNGRYGGYAQAVEFWKVNNWY